MFYVRHHDDQVAMFNSKCQNVVLLNHMKKILGVSGGIDLLLQQAEYKNLATVGMSDKGETTYANTFLQFRSTYILLGVQEDEEGCKEYTVLWKSKNDESEKIVAVLEARLADDRKKATGKGKAKK